MAHQHVCIVPRGTLGAISAIAATLLAAASVAAAAGLEPGDSTAIDVPHMEATPALVPLDRSGFLDSDAMHPLPGGLDFSASTPSDDSPRRTPVNPNPRFDDDPFPEEDIDPPGARSGVFQRVTLESTWLAPGNRPQDIGVTDVEVRSMFGLPCPTRQTPILITPGYAIHLFDGPESFFAPGEVYDAYLQLRWTGRLTPRFRLDMAAWPGWYSDFHQTSNRAFRAPAYIAGIYRFNSAWKIVVGVSYLDRRDINFLPIGGLVWTPDDATSVDIVVPKPRIARRIDGGCDRFDPRQLWVYVAGELGGGTWAVERPDGVSDYLSYRDYRALVGIERKAIGGLGAWLEAGYAFSRKLQYDNAPWVDRPENTLMVRGGLSY